MAEERIHVSANVRAQRVGVVDVEGRPIAVGELHEIRATDREMAIATDDRFLRPDRAIDLYELCGGSSGRDSMNSLNTASSWSSFDSAVIADRSRSGEGVARLPPVGARRVDW